MYSTEIQLTLVSLLKSWRVHPAAVLKHSSGEIAAAFTAGLAPFEAAIRIAYFRGIAAKEIFADQGVDGAILAIGTSAQKAQKLLQGSEDYAVVCSGQQSQQRDNLRRHGYHSACSPTGRAAGAFRAEAESHSSVSFAPHGKGGRFMSGIYHALLHCQIKSNQAATDDVAIHIVSHRNKTDCLIQQLHRIDQEPSPTSAVPASCGDAILEPLDC